MSKSNRPKSDKSPGDDRFTIKSTRLPRGRVRLRVYRGGKLRHSDSINLDRESDRRKFRKTVAEMFSVSEAKIDARLLKVMQEVEAGGGEPDPAAEAGSDAQQLVALGEEADLYHTGDGKAYATVDVNGHRETYALASRDVKLWLVRAFRSATGRPPGNEAISLALLALEARAKLDGPTREVHLRVAAIVEGDDPDDPTIYIDLCDAERRAVRVDRQGWAVVPETPVRFRRPRGMLPLPVPRRGGSLDRLRRLINLPGRRGWRLFLPWLLKVYYPPGPDPILIISGEQGSAKSSLAKGARLLTDPNTAGDRNIPRGIHDMMIAASNSAVLAYDNVSFLPEWVPDALCRLSTGSAFATRELYTDGDEVLFSAKRPIILNGIPDISGQGDVLDRAVLLHLPTIPPARRMPEARYWRRFAARRAKILGALLDCLVGALRVLPELPTSELPRMADFALFGEAVCRAAGEPPGSFARAAGSNREAAAEMVLDSSVMAGPIMALVTEENPAWEGQAQELLNLLPALADLDGTGGARGRHWPHTPKGVSSVLRRLAPALRVCGVEVEFFRGTDQARRRLIRITRVSPASR